MNTQQATVLPELSPVSPALPSPPSDVGQRILLHGVSWETYESLLADFQDSHAAHFTYDRGVLEIMVLSARHEELNRTLALLVEVVAEEMNIDVRRLGSTTFKHVDLDQGFEPDSCFYVQNESRIRGKKQIDLSVDPPPDLVIEIDLSSPSLDKLLIYAHTGVPEVWRYEGSRIRIHKLESGQYTEVEQSIVLSPLTGEMAARFLEESAELASTAWLRRVREWVRQQRG